MCRSFLSIQQEINSQLRAANALKKKSDKRKLSKGRIITAEEAKKIKEQKEETLRKAEEEKQRQRTRKKHLQSEILKGVTTTSILLAMLVLLTLLVLNLSSVNPVLPAPINLVLLAASLGGGAVSMQIMFPSQLFMIHSSPLVIDL